MPETVNGITFAVLAVAILGTAIMMMLSRNVMHAAYWLLACMMATAGLYLLLSAEFLALVQVLVYAGAVAVLILFVIMLTLRSREEAVRPLDLSLSAFGLAVAFGVAVYAALAASDAPSTATMPDTTPGVAELGTELFTTWVLPFELASLVLLVALIGAVWWAGGERE
jgi:NADH-quinone oxidoreductase subunit J